MGPSRPHFAARSPLGRLTGSVGFFFRVSTTPAYEEILGFPRSFIVFAWAFEGVPYHDLGIYTYNIQLNGAFRELNVPEAAVC